MGLLYNWYDITSMVPSLEDTVDHNVNDHYYIYTMIRLSSVLLIPEPLNQIHIIWTIWFIENHISMITIQLNEDTGTGRPGQIIVRHDILGFLK